MATEYIQELSLGGVTRGCFVNDYLGHSESARHNLPIPSSFQREPKYRDPCSLMLGLRELLLLRTSVRSFD